MYDLTKYAYGYQYDTPDSGIFHPVLALFGSRILLDPVFVEIMVAQLLLKNNRL